MTKGEQVVIPPSCGDNIMADIDESHAGINKPLNTATGHPASVGARTGLEEHNLTFGAALNKWLARNLGHLKYRVGFAQKQFDWIFNAFCSTRFYLLKLVFTLHLGFGKVQLRKLTLWSSVM